MKINYTSIKRNRKITKNQVGKEEKSGSRPLGKATEEKRDPSWGVIRSSHILGAPTLEYNTRKTSPLSSLESQWDNQEGLKKPSNINKPQGNHKSKSYNK